VFLLSFSSNHQYQDAQTLRMCVAAGGKRSVIMSLSSAQQDKSFLCYSANLMFITVSLYLEFESGVRAVQFSETPSE
jgi:hypothetical protein